MAQGNVQAARRHIICLIVIIIIIAALGMLISEHCQLQE
jgi:hypothetical protein